VVGNPTGDDMKQLLKGVWLSDGHVRARQVKRLKKQGSSTWLKIVLSEGKNREIRRMLARLGHKVLHLRRTAIGPVLLGKMPRGKSRRLTLEELNALRQLVEKHAPEDSAEKEPEESTAEQRR
jgi:23S rRNA pseudouridine2605 synthase